MKLHHACYPVALAKVVGVTAISVPCLWFAYRSLLPKHRVVPLILTGTGALFVGGVVRRYMTLHCLEEFIQRQPADQYPVAAQARTVLRSYCPTHPFVASIPPVADVLPSDRYLLAAKEQYKQYKQ